MRTLLVIGALALGLESPAQDKGWRFEKVDPITKLPIVKIDAKSFEATGDGSTFHLHDVTARLYDSRGLPAKQITSKEAIVDEKQGTLAYGPKLQSVVKMYNPAK